MRHLVGLLIAAFLILCGQAAPSNGQPLVWQQVGFINPGGAGALLSCGYFWDAQQGVVGGDVIYYTTDGMTWLPAQCPQTPQYVSNIRSFDGGKTLYAQSWNFDELWKSTDRGANWSVAASGKGTDMYWDYATSTAVILPSTVGTSVGRMDVNYMMASPVDEKKLAAPMYSTDGGKTWKQGTFISALPANYASGGIAAYADTINRIYYAISEVGTLWIMKSTDLGQTWGFLPNPTLTLGIDFLDGADNRMYYHGVKGMNISLDGGNTWSNIGGPGSVAQLSANDDQRFILFGCKGQSIVCFDDSGGIWMANATTSSALKLQTPPLLSVGCSAESAMITLVNSNCQQVRITDVTTPPVLTIRPFDSLFAVTDTIQFVADPLPKDTAITVAVRVRGYYGTPQSPFDTIIYVSIKYSSNSSILVATVPKVDMVSPNPCTATDTILILRNIGCDTLRVPHQQLGLLTGWSVTPSSDTARVPPGGFDTIHVHYAPGTPGTYSQRLSYTFIPSSGIGGGITNVDLTSTVPVGAPSVTLSSQSIALGSRVFCADTTVSVSIRNTGCDSLRVTNTHLGQGDPFTLLNSKDTILAPGEVVTRRITYHGSILGLHSDLLSQHISRSDGALGADTAVAVACTVVDDPNRFHLSTTSFDLGSRVGCADTIIEITLRNTGCDSLRISSAHIGGSNPFTLLNIEDTILAVGEVLTRRIQFHSTTSGLQTDHLIQHYSRVDGSVGADTSVVLACTVLKLPTQLQSLSAAIDVGKTYVCEERDTFVVIHNPSCERVCVSSVQLAPPAFVLAAGQVSAFCIEGGQSDTVRLSSRIDTSGGVTTNFATMTLTSDASQPFLPVTLSRGITYPVTWGLLVSGADGSLPGSGITYKIVQHTLLPPDVTSLDFRLSYNDDVLRYIGSDNPFVSAAAKYRDANGFAHQMYHLSFVIADTTLATLHFSTFLSIYPSTQVRIDSVSFTSAKSGPLDCITSVISDSSNPKSYTTYSICGGGTLLTTLKDQPINFDAAQPNPAHEEVRLPYLSNGSGQASAIVTMEDVLGRVTSSRTLQLTLGSPGEITFPLAGLPGGVYRIRVESGGFVWSKQFVKE